MGVVLELENVKKNYGKKEAVRGISFIIKEGEIVGFIGPNGAGKSTTIKMIVGLIRATSGNIKVFGHNIEENRIEALKNIGCIVENPELYEYMSGWDNILQFARIFGIKDTEKLKEIVDFVGLKDAINRKVKTYSLGMKQRLALAVSLVSSPKFLILDEPTNGLDPSGIIEFRNLLKKLAKENNTTIFVSSHNLNEIEEICDRVVFIKDGLIELDETIDKLKNAHDSDGKLIFVLVLQNKVDECKQFISNNINYAEIIEIDGNLIKLKIANEDTSKLITSIITNGFELKETYSQKMTLEDKYIELYQKED